MHLDSDAERRIDPRAIRARLDTESMIFIRMELEMDKVLLEHIIKCLLIQGTSKWIKEHLFFLYPKNIFCTE